MYKFEISADSMQEFETKKIEVARFWLRETEPTSNKNFSSPTFEQIPPQMPCFPANTGTTSTNFDYDEDTYEETATPAPVPVSEINNFSDVDSRGLPWDERIHANTKAKNKDNSWRYKRGTSDDLIKQVEEELIAKIKSGQVIQAPTLPVSPLPVPAPVTAAPVIPPPPAPTIPVATPVFQTPAPVVELPTSQVAATPAQTYENVPVPQGVRPAYTLKAFKDNLTVIFADLINQGKIDQGYINQLKSYFGIKEIWNILGDESKCIELWRMFGSAEVGFITTVSEG